MICSTSTLGRKQVSQANRATNFNGCYNYLHLHLQQTTTNVSCFKGVGATPTTHLRRIIYIELDLSIVLKVKVCNDGILIRRHSSSNTYYITYDLTYSWYDTLFQSSGEKKFYQQVGQCIYIYLSTMYILFDRGIRMWLLKYIVEMNSRYILIFFFAT